jgi:hypothetical protein
MQNTVFTKSHLDPDIITTSNVENDTEIRDWMDYRISAQ